MPNAKSADVTNQSGLVLVSFSSDESMSELLLIVDAIESELSLDPSCCASASCTVVLGVAIIERLDCPCSTEAVALSDSDESLVRVWERV